jgi:hypothetical protein
MFRMLGLPSLLLFVSCSSNKTLTPEERRSALHSATSLAAESSAFLAYASLGKATEAFASGHIEYLRQETGRCGQELGSPAADSTDDAASIEAREQMQTLADTLARAKLRLQDRAALKAAHDRAEDIRKALESLNPPQ